MDHNRLGGFLQLIREGRAATERVRIVGDGLQAADRLDRGVGGYDRIATGPQASDVLSQSLSGRQMSLALL